MHPRIAPLRIPTQRRLQTLAVLWHSVSLAFFCCMFFLACSIPFLWPVFAFNDDAFETGRLRRVEMLRRLPMWSYYAAYFPLSLEKSAVLDPKGTYIFGFHPHGIISLAAFGNFATEATGFSALFPGITNTLLTLSSNFRIPFYREYLQFLGVGSVSRSSCEHLLQRGPGSAITIVVGGAQESLLSRPGKWDLVLHKRRGFIKLAIRTGAALVPVLAFGENDLFTQALNLPNSHLYRLQTLMKGIFGFTIPFFHARGVFNYDYGLMPWRRRVVTVVGRPVLVEREEHPGEETVDRVQQQYIAELMRVWEENKDKYATNRQSELRIIE